MRSWHVNWHMQRCIQKGTCRYTHGYTSAMYTVHPMASEHLLYQLTSSKASSCNSNSMALGVSGFRAGDAEAHMHFEHP